MIALHIESPKPDPLILERAVYMQEKLQKKLLFPLFALAIVAIGGTAYTFSHAGPLSVHAQAPVNNQVNKQPDKETQDDTVTPSTIQKVQQNTNPQVNQQDNGMDGETQDGK